MDVGHLQTIFLQYAANSFREGILDGQFIQLQELQVEDDSNPDFMIEILSDFFKDSQEIVNDLTNILNQQSDLVHKLKGGSSSIGAQRVRNACNTFHNFCEQKNVQMFGMCLQQVRQEYSLVKNKLDNLLWLQQQIIAAGGAVPLLKDFF